MTDITNLMNTYRECSRNLWNAYFSSREFTWDLHDEYGNIRKMLFNALVVYELDLEIECCSIGAAPSPVLNVVPTANSVPILINRPSKEGNGYWDAEMDMSVGEGDIRLLFIDYFDFAQFPIKDFKFYRCKILQFTKRTKYEGREALIEVADGKVFYDAEQSAPNELTLPPLKLRARHQGPNRYFLTPPARRSSCLRI